MRVRVTTSVVPSWAVQDSAVTIVAVDLHPSDRHESCAPEKALRSLPTVNVKLDGVEFEFLPPKPCIAHTTVGYSPICSNCKCFPGVVTIKPVKRSWLLTSSGSFTTTVIRTQLPILPENAFALYSLHGSTTDPGMLAHFDMPPKSGHDIKLVIIYVLLSRILSLDRLLSIGLDTSIRKIIEAGLREAVVGPFEDLFRDKSQATALAAKKARESLRRPPAA